jgi:hypothetical protein
MVIGLGIIGLISTMRDREIANINTKGPCKWMNIVTFNGELFG